MAFTIHIYDEGGFRTGAAPCKASDEKEAEVACRSACEKLASGQYAALVEEIGAGSRWMLGYVQKGGKSARQL